jgi:hypothetical protein
MRVAPVHLGELVERVCPPRPMLDREVLWRAAATLAVAALTFLSVFGK